MKLLIIFLLLIFIIFIILNKIFNINENYTGLNTDFFKLNLTKNNYIFDENKNITKCDINGQNCITKNFKYHFNTPESVRLVKNKVETSVFKAFSILKIKHKKKPLLLFFLVLQKIKPIIHVKVIGFGKKKYNIPYNLSVVTKYKLAIKWLALSIKKRKETSLEFKIVGELNSLLLGNDSESLKKRNTLYFQAQRNRHLINFI